MFKIDKIEFEKPLLLAPMEDVTGLGFRKLCKELGADIVYTEFVNSDGLIRNNKKTAKKMEIVDEERPVGIQIYGADIDSMVEAARMAEKLNPDVIDINAGCWVKKVVKRGAGSGLLKDPDYMQAMVRAIVDAVEIPVTVKTRIGGDADSIMICEIAKRLEDVGARQLTIHCRHSRQGHSGEPDWSYIPKIKDVVDIPVVLNGGVFTAEDTKRAFEETGADGVMIARGAINHPWIFKESKHLLATGELMPELTPNERIKTALKHLKYEIEYKDEERQAVIPFRKYYSGYLKGLYGSSKVRQELMKYIEYAPIEEILLNYLEKLNNYSEG
jgi:tRNA-dihydrouridine synthase B